MVHGYRYPCTTEPLSSAAWWCEPEIFFAYIYFFGQAFKHQKFSAWQEHFLKMLDQNIASDTARSMEPVEAARSSMEAGPGDASDPRGVSKHYAFEKGSSVALDIEVTDAWESAKTVLETLDR